MLPNPQYTLMIETELFPETSANLHFFATKPPAHPDDGDGVSCRNVRKPSQFFLLPNNQHTLMMVTELFPETSANLHSIFATKPPAHPGDGDGVSCRNVRKHSQLWCYQTTSTS